MIINQAYAKGVAIDFLKRTGQELEGMLIGRVTKQVKMLLTQGYTEEEIDYCINNVLRHKSIYSFGYIEKVIEEYTIKYRAEIRKVKAKEKVQAMTEHRFIDVGSEVKQEDEASERNRRKAQGLGYKPDPRTKSYFDLFEEQ